MNGELTSEIFGNKWVRIALTSVLALLALFLLIESISAVQNLGRLSNPATDVIMVNGEGQATLAPDVARVSFTVENTSESVIDAQNTTTKQANTAIEFVKGQGIADKDIKMLAYTISPEYSYPNPCVGVSCPAYRDSAKIIGYRVAETVQVTVRDIPKVGALLSGLGKLSVQNVSGPSFALDDATAGYDLARADAINKAKTQATLLAKQLGVKLGKIVNFNESSGGYRYPVAYSMGEGKGGGIDMAATTPTVPVGENTYSASVSITYEIR